MTHHSPQLHSPTQHAAERPKGILKNSNPYHRSNSQTSPINEAAPIQLVHSAERPELGREMSEKEIVLENTLRNAGAAHRRSSSNPRGPPSRRQSGTAMNQADENSPRLKWDEANLYLTEQQRDSTMKITEPKTPFASHYDPSEDEEELAAINAEDLMVDELDKAKSRKKPGRMDDIPDFDLGEPELEAHVSHTPDSEKRVIVEADPEGDVGRHGEEFPHMTPEELEKHRKFEAMRRKHYEMKNVKDLLGHPEDLDGDDEDDAAPPLPPPVSTLPNGQ